MTQQPPPPPMGGRPLPPLPPELPKPFIFRLAAFVGALAVFVVLAVGLVATLGVLRKLILWGWS